MVKLVALPKSIEMHMAKKLVTVWGEGVAAEGLRLREWSGGRLTAAASLALRGSAPQGLAGGGS